MTGPLERFARKHVERKLAAAGVTPSQEELSRLVSVLRQAMPGDERRDATTPAPVVAGEAQTLTRFALYFRRAEMTVELNANTG